MSCDGIVSLDNDVKRLAAAVGDNTVDRVRVWVLLRKIAYVIECGYKPGEEELKNLLQVLKKLRCVLTPRDVCIANNALYLLEAMDNVCPDGLMSEIIGIHREYNKFTESSPFRGFT